MRSTAVDGEGRVIFDRGVVAYFFDISRTLYVCEWRFNGSEEKAL